MRLARSLRRLRDGYVEQDTELQMRYELLGDRGEVRRRCVAPRCSMRP